MSQWLQFYLSVQSGKNRVIEQVKKAGKKSTSDKFNEIMKSSKLQHHIPEPRAYMLD